MFYLWICCIDNNIQTMVILLDCPSEYVARVRGENGNLITDTKDSNPKSVQKITF